MLDPAAVQNGDNGRNNLHGKFRQGIERQQDLDNEIRIHNHVLLPGQRATKPTFL